MAAALALLSATVPAGSGSTQKMSVMLAYTALGLLTATLVLGPLRVLRHRPNPRSQDLRRDLAIWCGATGMAHVVLSFQHHLGGQVVRYFFSTDTVSLATLRRDRFGVANQLGLVATLILVLLLSISNDWALRRLGRRWKSLQRSAYALGVLSVIHTALYWSLLDRSSVLKLAVGASVVGVAVLQVSGRRVLRLGAKAPSGAARLDTGEVDVRGRRP